MEFKGTVKRVVDGDTIDVLVELPLDVYKLERVRFLDVNAPELNTPEGLISKEFIVNLLANKVIKLIVNDKHTRDKYGRLLAYVQYDGQDVIALMVDKQLAVKMKY